MTQTMLAGRMNFATQRFAVMEVPVPTPGPGEVRVRVRAAGVCLSDVHLIDGTLRPLLLKGDEVTLGHEVAGEVETLGAGAGAEAEADGLKVGARVIVNAGKRVGDVVWTMGVDYDGGWAEYLVAPVELLVPIPDDLPFEQAAIIPDAVSTPWGAIEWTGKVKAGESVGVWGVGGLGAHGVQLLRFSGAAPIIAVDPLAAARERALEFGADVALDPADPGFAQGMLTVTRGRGLDVALDFAGVPAVRAQALACLGLGGRLVVVGISAERLDIGRDSTFVYTRRQVLGHYGYEERHVSDLVRLTELGRLDFSASISATIPLAEAATAVARLESKEGNPIRLVLIP
jgi:D-arabinose 1-dehydrogenase-like Zn-dependent alcohol dehydrogenase